MRRRLAVVAVVAALCACAAPYRTPPLEDLHYVSASVDGPVTFEYADRVYLKMRDSRYERTEARHDIRTVAVRATNHTTRPITLARDDVLVTDADGDTIATVDPRMVHRRTRQRWYAYVLWAGWVASIPRDGRDDLTIPFGTPMALFNIFLALNSNSRRKRDLAERSLFGREIAPGESIVGYVHVIDPDWRPLRFAFSAAAPDARPTRSSRP